MTMHVYSECSVSGKDRGDGPRTYTHAKPVHKGVILNIRTCSTCTLYMHMYDYNNTNQQDQRKRVWGVNSAKVAFSH